ncbi:MAG: L-fuculokinase [Deltaproteobacteria bacterium]|nr:L-fuculokinase [Candidatus Zymogenaceae bacterium]
MNAPTHVVLVLDCGATNVRAITVDARGNILHSSYKDNRSVRQFPDRAWLIWDFEAIWEKLVQCAREVIARVGKKSVAAVVVTTFGDDGAPVDVDGNLLYPIISWQCPRTVPVAERIDDYIPFIDLFSISGEQVMRQHTIMRLLWFWENNPDIIENAHAYLMTPGLINHKLTGRMVNDPTTADCTMLIDIRKRIFSTDLLGRLGFVPSFFGEMVEPGEIIGPLTKDAASLLGLAPNVPVVAAGHDTQFAVCGSGCRPNDAVLSSGTWEILFLRHHRPITTDAAREAGLKNECDAICGLFNVGQQWIASGALEWTSRLFFRDCISDPERYAKMIDEARNHPPGSGGVFVEPSFLQGTGVTGHHNTAGTILGLTLHTERGQIYRAFLEGLSFHLRMAMNLLSKHTDVFPGMLTLVGGGAKNDLWNRIRADVLNMPIRLTRQRENTVVGAAVFGFIGAGIYKNFDEAHNAIDFFTDIIEPSQERTIYDELFDRFLTIGPDLSDFYRR